MDAPRKPPHRAPRKRARQAATGPIRDSNPWTPPELVAHPKRARRRRASQEADSGAVIVLGAVLLIGAIVVVVAVAANNNKSGWESAKSAETGVPATVDPALSYFQTTMVKILSLTDRAMQARQDRHVGNYVYTFAMRDIWKARKLLDDGKGLNSGQKRSIEGHLRAAKVLLDLPR